VGVSLKNMKDKTLTAAFAAHESRSHDPMGRVVSAHLQTREEFIIPSLAPAGMAGRVIVHREGGMQWRWFRSLEEARKWMHSLKIVVDAA
jgi:hypothetical protein